MRYFTVLLLLAAAAFALLYVFSPVDAILDIIPGVGFLDDAAVLAMCLKLVETELSRYKAGKEPREVEVAKV